MITDLKAEAERMARQAAWLGARLGKPRVRLRIASTVSADGALRRVMLPVGRPDRDGRGPLFRFIGPHGEEDCICWTCGAGDDPQRIARAWVRFCLHHLRKLGFDCGDFLLPGGGAIVSGNQVLRFPLTSVRVPHVYAPLPSCEGEGGRAPGPTGPQGRTAAAPGGACPRSGAQP